MDSMSADVAEDSKEASTETMEVAVSEEDLEDTMVARSRPRKLNDPSENSSKTSKKRGEQIRQAVRRHRLEMSEEKKNEKREKDRIYVAKKRELKRMEEEKKGIIRKGPKKKEEGYLWNEQEKNRDYKRKKRANRTEEEIEFDRIENVLAVRKHRASRTGKQCLLDRMKQQQSSRDFNEFGRLRPYKERLNGKRSMKNRDEHVMWQKYINTRKENLNLLGEKKPEIVSKVRKKEKEDLEKYEAKRKAKEEEEKKRWEEGYWHYQGDVDVFIWVGKGPQPPDPYAHEVELTNPYTEDDPDWKEWKKNEKELLEKEARDYEETYKEWAREDKERKRVRNAEAGKKHYRKKMKQLSEAIETEETKEAEERRRAKNAEAGRKHYKKKMKQLSEAIEIPDYEKSDYERLRDRNIQEIEDMKKASGLFKKKDKM